MGKSKIEWTDATWPVVTGCSQVSLGCRNCYAARMAATRLKHHPRYRGLAYIGAPGWPHWTGKVKLNHDMLEQPLRWKKPRMIFVASMGDLFHEDVPAEFIHQVFDVMAEAQQHTFQVLTKRPDRMRWFLKVYAQWPGREDPFPNVWLGVSVENPDYLRRIEELMKCPAAVRFASCEPLLGMIKIPVYLRKYDNRLTTDERYTGSLDWVIVGGESGPGARPMHPDWARSIRDQCQAAGVAFFFKQWGAWIPADQWGATCQEKVAANPWGTLDDEGNWFPLTTPWNGRQGEDSPEREYVMIRVGKKLAGRLLDGVLWEEVPNVKT